MIIIYHNRATITSIKGPEDYDFSAELGQYLPEILLRLAEQFNNEILVWCHEQQKFNLNVEVVTNLFHHHKLLYSYNPSATDYFGGTLGYIEDSPFINVNKQERYATWQMSSQVGAIHATTLHACRHWLDHEKDFDYFLNSLAKRAILHGLICYSEPSLLKDRSFAAPLPNAGLYKLFRFAKQHYRTRWIFLLFFQLLVYEKRLALLPMLASFWYKKRSIRPDGLHQLPLASTRSIIKKKTIDVLIPTIGRKDYLLEVLNRLAAQTHLPVNVIIIEQNPQEGSTSALDYIYTKTWPFTIKHHFTHRAGVCYARNLGIEKIESEFCFFADDDIEFSDDLLQNAFDAFQYTGNEVLLVACHLKSQSIKPDVPKQFTVFGAGHAFLKTSCLQGIRFNLGYEFGFGEDNDFGMQLRHKGYDILYISTSNILHLKAPMGGFRTKHVLPWQHESTQPKPSPTVMLFRLLYDTPEQLLNYKTTLFFKNLTINFFLNPFSYIKSFREKWDISVYWAKRLKQV